MEESTWKIRHIYACLVLLLLLLSFILGQNLSSPTPAGSPSPSPTASPSGPPTPSPSPTPLPGAQNFHQWGSVTLFNGLPSDNVRAIAQTPDGVMWFGTDAGLARFDGRRMEAIDLFQGITFKILSLETGADGELWIGTDRGAYRYLDGRFETIDDPKWCAGDCLYASAPINAILPGETTLMASTNGVLFGVRHLQSLSFEFTPRDLAGERSYTGIAKTSSGLMLGTFGSGIAKLHDTGSITTIDKPVFINALVQDPSDKIWIGAKAADNESGLYIANESGTTERVGTSLGTVLSIEPDGRGGAWVGTEKEGLYHFQGTEQTQHLTFETTAGGLRSNKVNTVYLDREGVLWIGTPRGVCRYDGSSPYIQILADSPNSNFVRTLRYGPNGKIYAGTNRGLFMLDTKGWTQVPGFGGKAIYALGNDQSGKLVVGGPGGVLDSSGKKVTEGDIRAFANFRGKTYAAIFDRGLQAVNDPKAPLVFSGSTPTALYEAPDRLWIGTSATDVVTYDGEDITPQPGFTGQQLGAIWQIAPAGNGYFWIACTKGLYIYKEGILNRIVPNYDVRDIIANGSDVWAATQNGGLLHIGYDELFGWVVSDLNVEQGLPSQQVFTLLRDGDRLLVGTNRGIVHYTPGTVLPKVILSRVLSRRLHVPDEWPKGIELEYPQNSLLVEVAGQSSRTFPEQFQYAFVVKNAKGEILEKKLSRDAQFAPVGLPPGTYTIEAKAFNKDLLFSDPVTVNYTIQKAPFPWTATALAVLLAIAIIALLLAISERRQLYKRNRELAAARLDLANEAERERRRIARDLHDQTLADLRNLMLKSDKLTPGNTEFRDEIESVSTEVRRICEDLSPSVLENVGLTAALEFLVSNTIDDHRFTAAEGLEDRIDFPLNIQLQIYRIAQEVLTNIKRHSTATAVEMELSINDENDFLLRISDNGEFFDAQQNPKKGRGVSNIRARASLVNAKIKWRAGENKGTVFTLRKPLE